MTYKEVFISLEMHDEEGRRRKGWTPNSNGERTSDGQDMADGGEMAKNQNVEKDGLPDSDATIVIPNEDAYSSKDKTKEVNCLYKLCRYTKIATWDKATAFDDSYIWIMATGNLGKSGTLRE